MFDWMGVMPLRKPMAIGAFNFVRLLTLIIVFASICGKSIQIEVLEFLWKVTAAMIVPIFGYYYTSAYADKLRAEHPAKEEE